MAVILSLLMIILSSTAVLAAETLNVSPSSGPIDQIVTISGRDYDFGDKVYIFFSSEELDEGDDIEDLKIYEQISTYAGLEV
jgi:hypothetical protein